MTYVKYDIYIYTSHHWELSREKLKDRQGQTHRKNISLLELKKTFDFTLNLNYRVPLKRALIYKYGKPRCLQEEYYKCSLIAPLCHLKSLWSCPFQCIYMSNFPPYTPLLYIHILQVIYLQPLQLLC